MPRFVALDGKWAKSLVMIGALVTACVGAASGSSDCKSSPCMYGICVDEPSHGSYRCYCIDGYTGVNCEINWDECWSNPCLNGGTCNDAIASYNCTCPEGFVGVHCEQRYSQCMSQPCRNGGTCLDYNGAISCQCLEGFSGEFCETDASVCNSSVCQNSAECLEGPGLSFSCRCAEGWLGAFCERDADECAAEVCQNGGLCINLPGGYQCACLFGFTGKDCDKPLVACEDNVCENGAVCLLEDAQPRCYCVPDYHGLLCELRYDDCESKYARCDNGGSCVDGVNDFSCSCPAPYVGDSCATALSTPSTAPLDEEATLESRRADDATTARGSEAAGLTSLASLEPDYHETSIDDSSLSSSPTAATLSPDTPAVVTMLPTAATLSPDTPAVVTMLPTSIPSATTELAADTTLPPSLDEQRPTDDYFTSVTDFHRSTFGSDIDQVTATATDTATDTATATATADYPSSFVHACTVEQCANTTRCIYNASQCDCSYRDNCRTHHPSASLSNAAFNGKSYIRQKFSLDSGILSIFVRLKTKAKSGILIHALFDDERYVLLYVESGQLKFQFSCGLQTMLFGELDSPVNNGYEVDLEMRFEYIVEQASDRCSARLLVNGTVAMSGEQLLQTHETVPQFARLHLGGIPVAFSHQFPQIVLGFVGCMSLLKVNQVERDFIRDSIEAVQIEECRSFVCLSNPCKNFGACEEVEGGATTCKCIAGYSGPLCERSICDEEPCHVGATCLMNPGVNFICVCPLGAHGLFCEKDTTIVQPSFSVFAPGFSSYMAYGVGASLKDSMELRMRIIPQNLEQISLIAYMGQTGAKRDSSDHFSVTYVRGYLMLTWDLGSGVRRIFTSSPINSRAGHKAHALQIGRRGRDSWLYVEGVGNVTARAAGTNTRLDVSPILYIGGHKTKYFESLPHDLPLHTGFAGCIYDIELRTDDNVFPITMASPATGRGIGECHRNECSHHSCKNGAVCLNYGPTYSCICMKDWQGPDCSNPINCTSSNSLQCH